MSNMVTVTFEDSTNSVTNVVIDDVQAVPGSVSGTWTAWIPAQDETGYYVEWDQSGYPGAPATTEGSAYETTDTPTISVSYTDSIAS